MIGAFYTFGKRDGMGRFHVGFDFLFVFILRRGGIVVSDNVRRVRSGRTSRRTGVGGGSISRRTVSTVFRAASLTP